MLCVEARAKINWTLDILGVREDGYHLLNMLMQTITLSDLLWLEEADALTLIAADEKGAPIGGDSLGNVRFDESNLVWRAAQALQREAGLPLGARIRLYKRIPVGAGLGGGSADAAAALMGLNQLWKLSLSQARLKEIALSLGADVPFLLEGGLARIGGIGEKIDPLPVDRDWWLVVIQPCEGLSTRDMYKGYDQCDQRTLDHPDNEKAVEAFLHANLNDLVPSMNNVLEPVGLAHRPAMGEAKKALTKKGAARAMMTGSGSAVYGVFENEEQATCAYQELRTVYDACFLTHTTAQGVRFMA